MPKVSGLPTQYSRFGETLSGDFFDRHCVVGAKGDLCPCGRAPSHRAEALELVRQLLNASGRLMLIETPPASHPEGIAAGDPIGSTEYSIKYAR
jgi:hypothetical protein